MVLLVIFLCALLKFSNIDSLIPRCPGIDRHEENVRVPKKSSQVSK